MRLYAVSALLLLVASIQPTEARQGRIPEQGFTSDTLNTTQLPDIAPQYISGVYVRDVDQNKPAGRAGLPDGVFILKVNGRPVVDQNALVNRFQQVWAADAPSLSLFIVNPYTLQSGVITIDLPPPEAAAPTQDLGTGITADANGSETMPVQLAPPPAVLLPRNPAMAPTPAEEEVAPPKPAPHAAENSATADGWSPPFLELNFRCVVKDGVPTADKAGGSYFHQVLRGDPGQRADQTSLYYQLFYTGNLEGASEHSWRNVDLYVYEIACAGGTANAADVARLTGAAVEGPAQRQTVLPAVLYFQNGALTAGKNMLPTGASIGPSMQMQRFPQWDAKQNRFTFTVLDLLPTQTPKPPTPFFMTPLFSAYAPIPQILLGILFALLALAIVASYKPLPSRTPLGLYSSLIVAIPFAIFLALTAQPYNTATLQAAIDRQMDVGRKAKAEIDALRLEVAQLTPIADGRLLPIKSQDLRSLGSKLTAHVIPGVTLPANPDPWFWLSLASLLPLLAFSHRIYLAITYFTTPHRPTQLAKPILKRGDALHRSDAFEHSLKPNMSEFSKPPSSRKSKMDKEKAKDLMAKIKQDGEVARAATERDRLTAQRAKAREQLRELNAQLPWWRRWFS